jgi:hypothetical protein
VRNRSTRVAAHRKPPCRRTECPALSAPKVRTKRCGLSGPPTRTGLAGNTVRPGEGYAVAAHQKRAQRRRVAPATTSPSLPHHCSGLVTRQPNPLRLDGSGLAGGVVRSDHPLDHVGTDERFQEVASLATDDQLLMSERWTSLASELVQDEAVEQG